MEKLQRLNESSRSCYYYNDSTPSKNMKMISTNVRISDETLEEIQRAADISGSPQADVIRLALKLGMASLAKIGFNPDAVIQAKLDELEAADKGTSSAPARPRAFKANGGRKERG